MLRRIARDGRDGFYKGETADLVVDEMKKGGGIISRADLERYESKWRQPITFTYRGHPVISMAPSSSGGVTLAMIAQQLAKLSSKAFARELQSSITLEHATPSSQVSGRTGNSHDGLHTTHFSVVDAAGNAVALTAKINSGFGSAVTVTRGGFVLNNEMDDFAAKPGSPNQFGLVQDEANPIAPGRRILPAMTPTMVLGTDGKPAIVTGASGGPFIITTAWEIISNILDYGMTASTAMCAPRMHHQHLPDEIALEQDGFDLPVRQALEKLRDRLTFFSVPRTGWTVAATIQRRGSVWHGMADPRLHGAGVPVYAAAYSS